MSTFEDVGPGGCCPEEVRQFLRKVGGTNPFGKERYRLVLAQFVRVQEAGHWHDWPENATLAERGGMVSEQASLLDDCPGSPTYGKEAIVPVNIRPSEQKPIRIVTEMRWVDRYDDLEGWMLQKWHPASDYNREEWEKIKLKNAPDLQVLGPFPVFGRYEPCTLWQADAALSVTDLGNPRPSAGGPLSLTLKRIPPVHKLEQAILSSDNQVRLPGATREARMKEYTNEWVHRETKRRTRLRAEKSAFLRDHTRPYWGTSLQSGRLREYLAKRAGIRTHVGN